MKSDGSVPQSWIISSVGEVFNIIGGGTPSTSNEGFWKGTVPWISSADINTDGKIQVRRYVTEEAIEQSATNKVPSGSVIVVTRVGLGKVAMAESDICFSQDCQGLLMDQRLLSAQFVRYQLATETAGFYAAARGTTISGITKKALCNTNFLLPPLREQRRIVAKIEELFSDLDAGVAASERAQANLRRYRAAVLKAAVEGKLTEEWRQANSPSESAQQLLQRILAERRRKWEEEQLAKYAEKGKTPPKGWKERYKEPAEPDTENLPPLPNSWCWANVGQLFFIDSGEAFKKKDYSNSGIRLLQIANVSFGHTQWEQENHLPEAFKESHSSLLLEPCDIVMALNRPILENRLKVALMSERDLPAILYQRVARLRALHPSLVQYAFHLFQARFFVRETRRRLRGTDQPYLNTSLLHEMPIPLPSAGEQSQIVNEVVRRLSIVGDSLKQCYLSLTRTGRLRQAILRQAFEGKLVPQDSADEPASKLLKRIKTERETAEAKVKAERASKRWVEEKA